MQIILLIEDDPIITRGLIINLKSQGYALKNCSTLSEARSILSKESFDLVLLDLNLPDGNGLELFENESNTIKTKPVIVLTANDDEESALNSFGKGVRDFMRKPFSFQELVARIKLALNQPQAKEQILHQGDLVMNIDRRQLWINGSEVILKNREFDIIHYFIKKPGIVITREQLIDYLNTPEISDRTIDTHISHIRSQFKKNKVENLKIKSIYGIGYKLEKKS